MKTYLVVPSLSVSIILMLAACVPTEEPVEAVPEAPTTEADLAAIDLLREDYVTAYNAEDVEKLLSLHTADAIRMSPEEPILVGAEAIRTDFAAGFEALDGTVTISEEEAEVAGDWSYSRGVFSVAIIVEGAEEPLEFVGKWMNILQRQGDGSWKIHRNIWNYDVPGPELSE